MLSQAPASSSSATQDACLQKGVGLALQHLLAGCHEALQAQPGRAGQRPWHLGVVHLHRTVLSSCQQGLATQTVPKPRCSSSVLDHSAGLRYVRGQLQACSVMGQSKGCQQGPHQPEHVCVGCAPH